MKKEERIVLLYPPAVLNNTSRFALPPLGVLYIASSLKRAGINVCVIDAQLHRMGMDDIIKKIIEKKPTILGVSVTTDVVLIVLEVIKHIKKIDKSIKVVLGGAHINATKDEIFSYTSDVDCVVYGEAEETFVELVQNFGNDIDGVIYPNRKFKIRPLKENLDELPFIDFNLIDDYKPYKVFYARNNRVGTLVVTRGCPFSCTFCDAFVTAGKKQRRMSAKRVVDEIMHLQKNWGVNYICFKDSTFTLNKQWVYSLCSELVRANIKWRCNTRVNSVDENLLYTMKQAGCTCISYGIESGSQRVLNTLKKGVTIEQIKKACKMTREVGIEIHASFMVGNPEETLEDANKTIELAKEINPDYALFHCTTAFPGTELYDNAVVEHTLNNPKWYIHRTNIEENKLLTSNDRGAWLKCSFDQGKLISWMYWSFYSRPSFILNSIVKVIKNPTFIYTILEAVPQILHLK